MKFSQGLITLIFIAALAGCASRATHPQISMDIVGGSIQKVKIYLKDHDVNSMIYDDWAGGSFTLLGKAVTHNKYDIAKYLLKSGANPNLKGQYGITPLFTAKTRDMVDLLVHHNADANARNVEKDTPLFWVTEIDVIEALLEAGADTAAVNGSGKTIVMNAQKELNSWLNHPTPNSATVQKWADEQRQKIHFLNNYVPVSKLLRYAKLGRIKKLKQELANGESLFLRDADGNTALHLAAIASHDNIVEYLIAKGADLSATNKQLKTALNLVLARKNRTARILSCAENQYCQSVSEFEQHIQLACSRQSDMQRCVTATQKDIHSVFISAEIEQRLAQLKYNTHCKQFNYLTCSALLNKYAGTHQEVKIKASLDQFRTKGEALFNQACGIKGSVKRCKHFTKQYAGFKNKQETDWAIVQLNQKCRLRETGWLYKSVACKAGFAHGNGKAVNSNKKLSYTGKFANGYRVNGKISYQDQPMYHGEIKTGKPHGKGVCFKDGEPEECKYYEGKRIDTLYKQRIELAKQQKSMDEKLAQMRSEQNQRLTQMEGKINTAASRQASTGNDISDILMDKAKRKAADKIMDKVFDKLF